jgi:CRISPR/Cas system-associated exonuclease Cas4 (RecB family)
MSYSFLAEAEKCPRAAFLKDSDYGELWDKPGYPQRPNAAAVAGSVVHAAAERILRQLIADGVSTTRSTAAAQSMRSLGGFSAVLSSAFEKALEKEAANPRFTEFEFTLRKQIEVRMPRMRESLQEILADRQLLASPDSTAGASLPRRGDHQRRSLLPGTHFEVELRDAVLRWKGRVDMLTLSDEGCSISDIKTGQPDDSHALQLQIYALLWSADSDLNSRQTPVTSLQIGYSAGVVTIEVPTQDESSALRAELLKRTRLIRQELSLPIVPAKPSPSNCGYCQVKLLCDDFWIAMPAMLSPTDKFRHIELTLTRQESDSLWVATTTSLKANPHKDEVYIKRPSERVSFWAELLPGIKLRLTDAMVTYGQPDEKPLISITAHTEPLLISAADARA